MGLSRIFRTFSDSSFLGHFSCLACHRGDIPVSIFADALLTHIAIGEGAKAKRKSAVRLSTADLQNEARRIVWDDLSEHLKQLSSGTQIVKELERLLIAA